MTTDTTSTNVIEYQTADRLAAIYHSHMSKAIDLLNQFDNCMQELNDTFGLIGAQKAFESSAEIMGETEPEKIAREMKRRAWSVLIEKLGLRKIMSPKRIEEFDHVLQQNRHRRPSEDPIDAFPEIHPDTIFQVLSGYAKSADEFLDETIDDVYQFLKPWNNDTYKTNAKNRWKLSNKIILTYAVERFYSGSFHLRYSNSADRIKALDSIFHLLDGKGFPKSHSGPLSDAIQDCNLSNPRNETEYFKIRCCKNGNLHLDFKRLDLVDEFNFRCGNRDQLPGSETGSYSSGYHQDEKQPPVAPNGDLNYFQTPEQLAETMVSDAGICEGMQVLEPSAGGCRIAKAIRHAGGSAFCYEIEADRFNEIKRSGFEAIQANFLDIDPAREFDAVVMNPPFSHCREIAHIRHAWRFLKDDGTLVAIASSAVLYRQEKKYVAFREWLSEIDADIQELPEETFKDSGTSVRTVKILAVRSSNRKI